MRRDSTRELLLQRISRVLRFLPTAAQCDPTAVHDARVATRRLREALPVVAPGKKGRALLKTTRRITRVLGPIRELDVALTTLSEFGSAKGISRGSIAPVRAAIAQEQRALRAGARRRLERCDLRAIGARALEEFVTPSTQQAARSILADAEVRAGRRAVRLRAAIENAAGIYLADRLHEVRIGVKKLRYALELVQELRGVRRSRRAAPAGYARTGAGRLRILREAQELLGRMHDLEVLAARTRVLQGTSAVTGLRVSADLDQLVRRLENECRDLHGRYMSERRHLLAVCDYAEASSKKHDLVRRAA